MCFSLFTVCYPFLKTGEPNLGSCHMTQSEQKMKHTKFFLAKLPEKPSVTSQYLSKCTELKFIMVSGNKSLTWNFFKVDAGDSIKATCNLCD